MLRKDAAESQVEVNKEHYEMIDNEVWKAVNKLVILKRKNI